MLTNRLIETAKTLAFLDVGPLNKGHALIIPKEHAVKMHELSDESLVDLLPVAKKVALAVGSENYNILQNNGTSFVSSVGFTDYTDIDTAFLDADFFQAPKPTRRLVMSTFT
jgi:hypothetical protein